MLTVQFHWFFFSPVKRIILWVWDVDDSETVYIIRAAMTSLIQTWRWPDPLIHIENKQTTHLHLPFIVGEFNAADDTGALFPDGSDVMTAIAWEYFSVISWCAVNNHCPLHQQVYCILAQRYTCANFEQPALVEIKTELFHAIFW